MFYGQHDPWRPRKLPWYGRWSNRLLVVSTILFMLLGIGLLVVGIVMLVMNKVLTKDEINAMLNETKYNGNLKVGNVMSSLPLLSICVGGVVFFLGIFACCARRRKNRICLTVISVLLLWFLIVLILTCAMWVVIRDKFENNVRGDLETLFEQYEGVEYDATKGWDLLHLGLDCCSLNVITSSSNQHTFNVTKWWANRTSGLDLVPGSCCSDATEDTYKTYTDSDCERILLAQNKRGLKINFATQWIDCDGSRESCYDEIVNWLKYFWTPAIMISQALIVVEVLLIFLSFVFCCGIRQSRDIRY